MISFQSITNFRNRLGPLQQLDISREELLRLLAEYVDEGANGLLVDFEVK